MFEFGDELILDNYSIPWLIWIQLLSMLLLLILLYYFTITPSDLSLQFSTATSSASDSLSVTGLPYVNRPFLTSNAANTHHKSKAREDEIKETRTTTSEVVQRAKKPDARERAEPSTKNEGGNMMFQHSHHPCHFFGLAKQAFLKCLGIDPTLEKHHEKDD